jgi:ribosomal protein S18 acetylase RimI-like enzyme
VEIHSVNDEITIRDAHPDEREAMLAMTLAAYQQYATIMPHWDHYRQMQRTLLTTDTVAERIVAERAGRLAGGVLLFPAEANVYASAGIKPDWPELRMLAVAPEARGLGVGKALLNECIRRSRAAGYAYLGLHTEDAMAVALGMYERAGFVRVSELDFKPTPDILVKGYRLTL